MRVAKFLFTFSLLVLASRGTTSAQSPPLRGHWESLDSEGRVVGIDLHFTEPESDPPVLEIGVFDRAKDGPRCGDENFFQPRKGETSIVSYSGDLLTIHYAGRKDGSDSIDLKLIFDRSKDQWTGHFHRGPFDEQVVLKKVPNETVVREPCVFGF
jgi:hypothetical protein